MDNALIERLPVTWLETKLKERNISWGVFVLLLCIFLFAIEIFYSLRPDVDNLKGIVIYDVVIEGYVLTVWTITRRMLTQSLKAIRPLIEDFVEPARALHREWQFAFGVGVPLTIAVILTNPIVNSTLNEYTTWLYILSQLIENSLLGWIVFALLASANQITHFIYQANSTNIFDVSPYRPVAHWCLSVTFAIMGAITVAVLFLGNDMMNTVNILTYTIAGVLGIFVFFAGMWSTHQHMQRNKDNELARINNELLGLHREIMVKVNGRELESSKMLMDASAGLLSHKHTVEKAEEWPYTVGSLGGLASTVFVPVVINMLGKIF